jgi:predicted nucleotidyltransferase
MDRDDPKLEALRHFFASESETAPKIMLAYLFGSRAEGREHAGSDWDIGVVSDSSMPYERRFELEREARRLLDGAEVQIVPMHSAPIELRFRVVATGRLLYERSIEERVEWEANTMSRYYDALPQLHRWREEVIEGGNADAAVRRYRESAGKARRLRESTRSDSDRLA